MQQKSMLPGTSTSQTSFWPNEALTLLLTTSLQPDNLLQQPVLGQQGFRGAAPRKNIPPSRTSGCRGEGSNVATLRRGRPTCSALCAWQPLSKASVSETCVALANLCPDLPMLCFKRPDATSSLAAG